jgi:hypothetical protein
MFSKILKLKQKGPLCSGTAVADEIPTNKVAGGEGRRWERQEGNKPVPVYGLGWGSGGPRHLAGGGTELTVGAGGGGGAPVRKKAQGPVM